MGDGRRLRDLGLTASILVLPVALAAQAPAEREKDPRATIPAGNLSLFVLDDSVYNRPRRIWVYTPPGYNERRPEPYPLIIAFDGRAYSDRLPLPLVLDTLLAARQTPPFVALMVDDSTGETRFGDLMNDRRMPELLGNQVLPWLHAGWNVPNDPQRVIATGISAGGAAAAFLAFTRPDLVGNVWSQSGAFWYRNPDSPKPPSEWLAAAIKHSERKEVRFYLQAGTDEQIPDYGPSLLDTNRHLRDVLKSKGYKVTLKEIPGGRHAMESWRPHLADGVVALTADWPR